MLGCCKLWTITGLGSFAAIVVGFWCGAMTGFWTFSGLTIVTALIYSGMNYSYFHEALNLSITKSVKIAALLILTLALYSIYSSSLGAPSTGAIALAAITTASISWAFTTMEPAGQ
jgi:chromate transport protein ChrA